MDPIKGNSDLSNRTEAYFKAVIAGDPAVTRQAGRDLAAEIRKTLQVLQTDFVARFIDTRIPQFPKDEALLNEKAEFTEEEIADLSVRMEKYARAVLREKKRFEKQFFWQVKEWGRRHRRSLLTILASVATFAVVIILVRLLFQPKNGLAAEYFEDTRLKTLYTKRIDSKIDFVWKNEGPFRSWRQDKFSVRWTGFLFVPVDGHYDLYVQFDDGVRLFVDDQPVVDDWHVGKARVGQGSVDLVAGFHPLRLEYFEKNRKALVRLFWRRPNEMRQEIIPTKYLFPKAKSRATSTSSHAESAMQSADDVSDKEFGPSSEDQKTTGASTDPK